MLTIFIVRVQVAPTAIPFDGAREGRVWAQVSASLPALRYIGQFLAAENKAVLESTHRGSLSASAKASQDAIRYRVQAIKHLNKVLQQPDTAVAESTLRCVSTMKHCEVCDRNEFILGKELTPTTRRLVGNSRHYRPIRRGSVPSSTWQEAWRS
jgi:hypothetical protein